jgi:NlpC/P60 family/Putative Flp pilus-assembly TadE/G-like
MAYFDKGRAIFHFAGWRRSEGSVTIVALACLMLFATLSLLLGDVGLYLASRNRAQDAADAAALAAVAESFPLFSSGSGPEKAARDLASDNGAKLLSLNVEGDGERVQVEVSVKTPSLILARMGIGEGTVKAVAAAEVDVDGLLSSGMLSYTQPGMTFLLRPGLAKGNGTAVVLLAMTHLGQRYVWGAEGPTTFDCSGLVYYVYAQCGVGLPRSTYDQVKVGRAVTPSELMPGDLIFFTRNSHVGMYVGSGSFIHAPHTGDVVKISPLSGRSISACRRIFN